MVAAVATSPSVLGSIEADKAESVAKLSGVSWANRNPKVLLYFPDIFFLKMFFFLLFSFHRRPDLKQLFVKTILTCF